MHHSGLNQFARVTLCPTMLRNRANVFQVAALGLLLLSAETCVPGQTPSRDQGPPTRQPWPSRPEITTTQPKKRPRPPNKNTTTTKKNTTPLRKKERERAASAVSARRPLCHASLIICLDSMSLHDTSPPPCPYVETSPPTWPRPSTRHLLLSTRRRRKSKQRTCKMQWNYRILCTSPYTRSALFAWIRICTTLVLTSAACRGLHATPGQRANMCCACLAARSRSPTPALPPWFAQYAVYRWHTTLIWQHQVVVNYRWCLLTLTQPRV